MISRRTFLIGAGAAAAALTTPYLTSRSTELNRRKLSLWKDNGPRLRLAHLTDLHSSKYVSLSHIQKSIEIITKEKPDFACITGDYVDSIAPDPQGLVSVLRILSDSIPTFACMGNHDGGAWLARRGGPATPAAVVELLRAANIRVLQDQSEKVQIKDRSFFLTGLHDLWSDKIDTRRAGLTNEREPRIILAHNPDTKDEIKNHKWELMLSGHTHGGQIRLPLFGGRLTAPVKDDRYIEGLLPWGEKHIHISRGIGALRGLRYNCPPEVNVIDLT